MKKELTQLYQFHVNFYGTVSQETFLVPQCINAKLLLAKTPEEIEHIISKHESELAALLNPVDEYLVCDTAAELMAEVLSSKGFSFRIVCGVNDNGDSHSYVQVGDKKYNPTHQGFGNYLNID